MSKLYGKISRGSWSLKSKKDPRFNCESVVGNVGWLHIPYEAVTRIKNLERQFGIEAPDDLELSYVKI